MQTAAEIVTPSKITHQDIVSMETPALWAILRSTNSLTERFCNQLTWAKSELRRRGFAVV